MRASLLDRTGRSGRLASCLPNFAFSTTITTAGGNKDFFVPTSPIEISISPAPGGANITFSLPVPPSFVSARRSSGLPAGIGATGDPDAGTNFEADYYDRGPVGYVFEGERSVATAPFGGHAQDEGIGKVRKELFEAVEKAGRKPLLDGGGRPQFFFLQNNAKTMWTKEGGLGMVVYEARPDFLKTNAVGIELEPEK
ncbi:hypothetical protein TeGR_g1784 [Tetraparma gracilis]|uniref:Uncharacterized protein n=1 Tax=Tetraparma gracilis TaxID=2962635 RepID=A0ABQ6N4C9_9STRA|nr:hypothetical protein TeGR_g1784 [Tetraparma gracilis]